MNLRPLLVISMALSFSMTACESDPATTATGEPICQPGVLVCIGDTLERCNAAGMGLTYYRDCPAGCDAGACVGGEGVSEGGDEGGAQNEGAEGGNEGPQEGEGEGQGDEAEGGAGDEGGGAGEGAVACDAGEQICVGDDIERCNLAGSGYVFNRNCPGGCAAGQCLEVPDEGGELAEGDEGDPPDEGGNEGPDEGADEGPDEGADEGSDEGGNEGVGEGEGEVPPADLCEENDVECPGSQLCEPASGECREGDECINDGDCIGNRLCIEQACRDRCQNNNDCPGIRECDLDTGRCPEPGFCILDADCDPGRSCVAGRCSDDCAADEDCPGLQTCDAGRFQCREPAACVDDGDCIAARLCDGAQCHDPCQEDGDCGGTTTCNGDDGHCVEGLRCRGDEDCLGFRACEGGSCFDPECQETQACAPEACVDRRCDDRPDAACAAANDCDGPQVCSPGGACVLDGRCEADEDCPAGAPACAGGWCAGCRDDDGCAAAEVCHLGWCELVRGCAADPDCPGDRQCDAGECAPIGCDGDRFDGLRLADRRLTARIYTGLVLCDGAPDTYRVTARAGEGIRITLRHTPGGGRVALRLHPQGSPQITSAWSDHRHGVERVALDATPGARPLELVIEGRPGWSPEYSLEIERIGVEQCVRDSFEGLLGNDDAAHAAVVGSGDHPHAVCASDEDWFAVPVGAGTILRVRSSPGPDAQGHAMEVQAPDGELLAQGAPAGGALVAQVTARVTGAYRVRVRSTRPAERFSTLLSVDALTSPDAQTLGCASAERIVPGEVHQLRAHIAADRFRLGCLGAPVGGMVTDHVVWFEMHQEDVIRLRLLGGQRRSILAIRSDCPDSRSEVQCEAGEGAEIAGLRLDAGVYYVIVRSPADADPPALLLDIGSRCEIDRDCPGGFHCDGGQCRVPCDDDQNACAEGLECDPDTGHCIEEDPCVSDASCAGVRACEPHVQEACFDPECEENSQCEADGCVDRTCGAVDVACGPEDPCDDPLVCSDSGSCVADGACDDDDDCPAGAPICHEESGTCVLCFGDAGCYAAEVCRPISDAAPVPTSCRYDGFCEDDDECPGTRFCQSQEFPEDHGNPWLCWAAECDGDRFDRDIGATAVRWRTYTSLMWCDGENDTYVLLVPAGAPGQVTLRHDPEEGDLALVIREADNPGVDVFRSNGGVGVERAEIPPADGEREINIIVEGRSGFSVGYSITLER